MDKNRVNRIAKSVVSYEDVMNIVRLFVGDKKIALSRLNKVTPFDFEMKTKSDTARYNRLVDDFFYDVLAVIEKNRKKFQEK